MFLKRINKIRNAFTLLPLAVLAALALSSSGSCQEQGWVIKDGKTSYLTYATGWKTIGENRYYFDEQGILQTGWLTLEDQTYYLSETTGILATGWMNLGGEKYYFNADGELQTGWIRVQGKSYYMDSRGRKCYGFLKRNGKTYYLDPVTGERTKGWVTRGTETYYFGSSGDLYTGTHTIQGKKYFFSSDGCVLNIADSRGTLDSVKDTLSLQSYNLKAPLTDSMNRKIQKAITDYGEYSVSFTLLDLNTGQALAYNPCLSLYSASAIKGPYEVCVLEAGNSYNDTIFNTIKFSDNYSYAYSRELYGADIFREWLREAGVDESQADDKYTSTTSLDLARMWLQMWDFFCDTSENAAWARETFQGVNASALVEELSERYTVYSKAGWIAEGGYYNVYNCAGIITDGSSPYILAIMSDCPAESGIEPARELIRVLDEAHRELISKQDQTA